MRTPKTSILPAATVVALTVVAAAFTGCNKGQQAGAPAGPGGIAVTAMPVIVEQTPLYMDEIGKATASESVTIQPQVSGKIMKRHFVDGADVKKGDLLFEIDPRPFQAAFDQADASWVQSKAALDYAKQDFSFVDKLQGTNAVSQETFEQKKNTVEVDEAQVQVAFAARQAAQVNLDYCKIFSPINGLAGQRLVDEGNVVLGASQATGTNLLTIQGLDPIYADFTVTEAELARVQSYMAKGNLTVTVETPADQQLSGAISNPSPDAPGAAPGVASGDVNTGIPTTLPTTGPAAVTVFKPRTGKLIFLDNSVQDGSGTVRLRAELPNADHHFWPGQFVNVRLILAQQKTILVPSVAAQISQQGLFVYKVVANDKSKTKFVAAQQPVTAGQEHGELVVIEQGLAAGDSVVVTGQMLLQPGAPIMILNAAAMKPASTQPSDSAKGDQK